jgi:hypothetical protein
LLFLCCRTGGTAWSCCLRYLFAHIGLVIVCNAVDERK